MDGFDSLGQYFPYRVHRNPTVLQNIVRASAINIGINKWKICNTAKNFKYPLKFLRNFCPAIGKTGVISLYYKMPLVLFRSVSI
jgi:hypothetical protein